MGPKNFVESAGSLSDMPEKYGFFSTDGLTTCDEKAARRALKEAKRITGRIDWVVFPEVALGLDQAESLSRQLRCTVIGGCGRAASKAQEVVNQAVVAIPLPESAAVVLRQDKHHRWKLNGSQVRQYALGRHLDPKREWWEDIKLVKREVKFQSVAPWLTLCVLVCEDLAQQDPVSDVVRAVGPDLVVALLMDGPQLAGRWPARYAAVLADDPGSSVLTLTSLGMTRLSCASPGYSESRVVAMWKEADNSFRELTLFHNAVGLVLSLKAEKREEFTADGRGDGKRAIRLSLEEVHQVYPSAD